MREMKDSGVEWIGEIPEQWQVCTVKNLCSMEAGKSLSADSIREEGLFPVYGGNGVRGFYSDYNCDGAVILVGRQGALCGNVHITYGRIWATEHAVITRNYSITDLKYLYYLLTAMELNQYVTTVAAQPGLAVGTIKTKKTVLPPIIEQKKIGKYLNGVCVKIYSIIKKQQTIIEKLKEYKSSIINEAVTKGLNRNVKVKKSGYRWIEDIPEHWEMIYAKKLFAQRKDRAYDTDEQLTSSQKYGIISQKTFMELEGRQVMQVLKGEEILKHVEKGDFVISMRSFQGGLEYSKVTGKISSAYVMLIPNQGFVYDNYYKWLFKSKKYISALQGTSNLIRDGQALRFSNFIQVYLPNPSIAEQKDIADYLDKKCPKIDEAISKRISLVNKLIEYKKSLIYEVVTGKRELQ